MMNRAAPLARTRQSTLTRRGGRAARQSCTVGAGRRGALVMGAGTAVGAFLVSGLTSLATAPRAHADFEDVIVQPIVDAIDHAVSLVDPGLSAGVDPGIAIDSLTSPALAAAATSAAPTYDDAYLPLQMDGAYPVIDVAAGGGPTIPVLLDTGSDGLVVPSADVPFWALMGSIGNPSDWVWGGYGAVHYVGVEVPTTVAIGDAPTGDPLYPGQVVTGQTEVTAVLGSWGPAQTWYEKLLNIDHVDFGSVQDFYPGTDGILGVGPNAPGPEYLWTGTHFPGTLVTAALPGGLKDGEFIMLNSAGDYLPGANSVIGFGPASDLDIGGAASSGAPITTVNVEIGGVMHQGVNATFDSGGLNGTIPSSLLGGGSSVVGQQISVYNTDGELLYSYTPTANDAPTVVSGSQMNTGIAPFEYGGLGDQGGGNYDGIYISNSPTGGMLMVP
jgi:hypothetical protein